MLLVEKARKIKSVNGSALQFTCYAQVYVSVFFVI